MWLYSSSLTTNVFSLRIHSRTTDTQWRHKSKKPEKLGWCGRQNMLWPYFKIWDWDLIFGHAVKTISSLGVRSSWIHLLSGSVHGKSAEKLTLLKFKSSNTCFSQLYCCTHQKFRPSIHLSTSDSHEILTAELCCN